MSEFQDRRRRELGAKLKRILDGVESPDLMVRKSELLDAGIPRKYADSISRASRRVTTAQEVDDLVEEWTDTIADERDAQDALRTPAELADVIQRPR